MIDKILKGIYRIVHDYSGDTSFSSETHTQKNWKGVPIEKVTMVTIVLKEKIA